MTKWIARHPGWPYVAPFATFVSLLALQRILPYGPEVWYPTRVLVVSAVLLAFSRHIVNFKVNFRVASVLLGLAVFVIWIVPDLLWPEYRDHWAFRNRLMAAEDTTPDQVQHNMALVLLRLISTIILVPIIEEIFWRGWLMRYLIARDFESMPVGSSTTQAFWISALLFASEHGPYWDVGLLAGILYNWWIIRTRNLADCVLAHAITNACLAAYVLQAGRWEYWLL